MSHLGVMGISGSTWEMAKSENILFKSENILLQQVWQVISKVVTKNNIARFAYFGLKKLTRIFPFPKGQLL